MLPTLRALLLTMCLGMRGLEMIGAYQWGEQWQDGTGLLKVSKRALISRLWLGILNVWRVRLCMTLLLAIRTEVYMYANKTQSRSHVVVAARNSWESSRMARQKRHLLCTRNGSDVLQWNGQGQLEDSKASPSDLDLSTGPRSPNYFHLLLRIGTRFLSFSFPSLGVSTRIGSWGHLVPGWVRFRSTF